MMKKIEVVVVEAGPDYLDKIDYFYMEVPEDRFQAVAKAIEAVKDRGYEVLHNNQGGNNEHVTVGNEKEYIGITVRGAEGEE
jgi:hypothetical protein